MSLVTFVAGNVLEAQQLNDSFSAVNVIKAFNEGTVTTAQATSSTSFTDLSTAGPSVTVTTGTTALVIVSAVINPQNSDAHGLMTFAVSGATTIAAADAQGLALGRGNSTTASSASRVYYVTLTAGSNTFTAKYRATTAAPVTFSTRQIMVITL
jgi:hypothetical protein